MKKILMSLIVISVLLVSVGGVIAAKVDCNTITEGEVMYSATHYLAGTPIPTDFDIYGYNYQAHLFIGSYFNVYSGGAGFPPYEGDDESYLAENPASSSHWAWPYRDVKVSMKWNDAWLSNKDCDFDGKLDRHYGFASYIGSGAWETNHQWGENEDGTDWNYFTKIVAAPEDAVINDGYWYMDDKEIGPVIWGEFATIFEIYNDPMTGDHGVSYKGEISGFGFYM